VDDALTGVYWALTTKADIYPMLPGCRSLRAIRTDDFTRTTGRSPVLRIYFKIIDDTLVELAWIEEVL
jgi:hypothetical protein